MNYFLALRIYPQYNFKLYCGCSPEDNGEPNSTVCPECLGFHESLPQYNPKTTPHIVSVLKSFNNHNVLINFKRVIRTVPQSNNGTQIKSNYFLNFVKSINESQTMHFRACLQESLARSLKEENKILLDFNRTGVPYWEVCSDTPFETLNEFEETVNYLKTRFEEATSLPCKVELDFRYERDLDITVNFLNLEPSQIRLALNNYLEESSYNIKKGVSIRGTFNYSLIDNRLEAISNPEMDSSTLNMSNRGFPDLHL